MIVNGVNFYVLFTGIIFVIFLGLYLYKSNSRYTVTILGIFLVIVFYISEKFYITDRMRDRPKFNYKNILTNRDRFVVSFTTIPSRTRFIPEVLKKIKNQTVQPDVIYINIPYYSKRKNTSYKLDFDTNVLDENVVISRCEDYGPATKLLGCISYEKDPNTMIITIDDDQNYSSSTFETLISYAMTEPDKVYAFNTLSPQLKGTKCPVGKNVETPDAFYAEGFGGVLYRRKFISEEMLDYFNNISTDCFVSDDLVISTWMDIEGYDRYKICDYRNTYMDNYIDAHDALRREKREEVYRNCSREMRTLLYRHESAKILGIFDKVMRENNIPYTIAYGTLLGAVRDNNFIETDHDIDVIILDQDKQRYFDLKDEFKRNGLITNYSDYINRLEIDKSIDGVQSSRKLHSYIDVFIFHKMEDGKYREIEYVNRKRWPREQYTQEQLFPIREYTIGSLKVLGPNDPISILETIYGDWQTPRESNEYVKA